MTPCMHKAPPAAASRRGHSVP